MKYGIIACIIVIAAFASCAGIFKFQANNFEAALHSEKLAHAQTQAQLENSLSRAEALADNARRCLAREAQAQADAAERTAILANAATRERTPQEKEKVVDEATRSAVIERINRSLRPRIPARDASSLRRE